MTQIQMTDNTGTDADTDKGTVPTDTDQRETDARQTQVQTQKDTARDRHRGRGLGWDRGGDRHEHKTFRGGPAREIYCPEKSRFLPVPTALVKALTVAHGLILRPRATHTRSVRSAERPPTRSALPPAKHQQPKSC